MLVVCFEEAVHASILYLYQLFSRLTGIQMLYPPLDASLKCLKLANINFTQHFGMYSAKSRILTRTFLSMLALFF